MWSPLLRGLVLETLLRFSLLASEQVDTVLSESVISVRHHHCSTYSPLTSDLADSDLTAQCVNWPPDSLCCVYSITPLSPLCASVSFLTSTLHKHLFWQWEKEWVQWRSKQLHRHLAYSFLLYWLFFCHTGKDFLILCCIKQLADIYSNLRLSLNWNLLFGFQFRGLLRKILYRHEVSTRHITEITKQ